MLFYSHDPGFSLKEWKNLPLKRIFAGLDCVMAITEDGQVLQKIADPAYAARTHYWKSITEIAISSHVAGAVLGLVSDGTCMVAKRPLREHFGEPGMRRINETVKSWRDITAICASDAFFALDKDGRVHHVSFDPQRDPYQDTESWEDVVFLTTGNQDSVFGVTRQGKVLFAGHNCVDGPNGDLRERPFYDVTGVCPAGSECERLLLFYRDGTVTDLQGTQYDEAAKKTPIRGCYLLSAYLDEQRKLQLLPYCGGALSLQPSHTQILDFAVGHRDGEPFCVAIGDRKNLFARLFG